MHTQNFEWVVQTYSPMLLRVAYLYLRNREEAEDVTQDVLLRYWQKQPHFDSEEAQKSWLYKTAVNRCKDFLRSHWFRKRCDLTQELSYLPEEESELLQCMMRLDAKFRIPLHLHYYEGYSLKEIGNILNIPTATVGSRLHRGKARLKELLGGYEYEEV